MHYVDLHIFSCSQCDQGPQSFDNFCQFTEPTIRNVVGRSYNLLFYYSQVSKFYRGLRYYRQVWEQRAIQNYIASEFYQEKRGGGLGGGPSNCFWPTNISLFINGVGGDMLVFGSPTKLGEGCASPGPLLGE